MPAVADDVELVLQRVEALRVNGASTWDAWRPLRDQGLPGLLYRIEHRGQLERLTAGLASADPVVERIDQLLASPWQRSQGTWRPPVSVSDDTLVSLAAQQISLLADAVQAGVGMADAAEDLATTLRDLDTVIGTTEDIADAGLNIGNPLLGDGSYTRTGPVSTADFDHLRLLLIEWFGAQTPISDEWVWIWDAFIHDHLANPDHLTSWMLAPVLTNAVPTEAVFELWQAGAVLRIECDRILVVRLSAEPLSAVNYSSNTRQAPPAAQDGRIAEVFEMARAGGGSFVQLNGFELQQLPTIEEPEFVQALALKDCRDIGDLAELAQFPNLSSLAIDGADLVAIPAGLRQLTLDDLNLAGNCLSDLPHWLGEMRCLVSLSLGAGLDGNQVSSFPESFRQLENLTRFSAARNSLDSLPEFVQHLPMVETLDFSSNEISSVPDWMTAMTNLNKLNLSGNPLVALPSDLGRLQSLKTLDLTGTSIDTLPASILDLPDRCQLRLRNTRLPDQLMTARRVGTLRELWT